MKRLKLVLNIISAFSMLSILTVSSAEEAKLMEFNNKAYWEFIDNYVPVKYSNELYGMTLYVHKGRVDLNHVIHEIESVDDYNNRFKSYAEGGISDNLVCYNCKLSVSENEINSFLEENGYKATATVNDSSDVVRLEFDETAGCDDRSETFYALKNNYEELSSFCHEQMMTTYKFKEENGDFNGDSLLNVRDCAGIAVAIAQNNELPYNADFNKDGEKNVRDAAAIAKHLAEK